MKSQRGHSVKVSVRKQKTRVQTLIELCCNLQMWELFSIVGCGAHVQFVLLPCCVGGEWTTQYGNGFPQQHRPVYPRISWICKQSNSGQRSADTVHGLSQTPLRHRLRPSQCVRLPPDGSWGIKHWWGIFIKSLVSFRREVLNELQRSVAVFHLLMNFQSLR
jgi:hypothetical protein